MGNHKLFRLAMIALSTALLALVAAGCGGNSDSDSAGAPAGASGDAAGGFAPEAGKQRDPKEVEQEKKNFSQEPPPVQLQSGDRSDLIVNTPTVKIARSQKELNSLIKQVGIPRSDVAPVDFKSRQVVLVQLPKQPRGTLMQIQDISVQNGVIVAKTALLKPGSGCKKPSYKPNPFNLVETRKMTEKTTKVNPNDVTSSPC